jgi:hypothetical protein
MISFVVFAVYYSCQGGEEMRQARVKGHVRLTLLLAVALALCVAACGERRAALVSADGRVLKVKVTRDGEVYLDGQLKTLDETDAELARLKKERGAVIYYREESAQHQPHPNALRVIHKIEELQLPVALSYKDFE